MPAALHILVISGWNITIIATALYAVAGGLKLSQRRAFWVIRRYGRIVHGPSSIVRLTNQIGLL